MKKRIMTFISLVALIALSMLLVACNHGGGDGADGGHKHTYIYELKAGEGEGEFILVGKCSDAECTDPDYVEENVNPSVKSETPATCSADGKRVYAYNKEGQTVLLEKTLPKLSHKIGETFATEYFIDSDGTIEYGTAGVSTPDGATLECESVISGDYTCSECNKVISVKLYVPHNGVWIADSTSTANCISGGKEYVDCTRCGERAERVSPPLGHLYKLSKTSNEDDSFDVKAYCQREGCTTPSLEILGVTNLTETVNKKANCYEDGILEYSFVKDGNIMVVRAISEKLSHKLGGKDVSKLLNANGRLQVTEDNKIFLSGIEDIACGGEGVCKFLCELCNKSVSINVVREHVPTGGVEITPPDCDSEGVKSFTCGECDESFEIAIDPLGHLYASPSGGDILKKDGNDKFSLVGKCTREGCDEEISLSGITRITSSDKASTCSSFGTRTYTVYGKDGKTTVLSVIPKLAHTVGGMASTVVTNKDGSINSDVLGIVIDESGSVSCGKVCDGYYVCEICSETVPTKVNVLPHHIESEENWAITAPTCQRTGLIVKECKYCDHTEEVVLDPEEDNHVFNWTVKYNGISSTTVSGICSEEGCTARIAPTHPDENSYSVESLGATCKTGGTVIHKWTVNGYPVEYDETVERFDHKIGGVPVSLVMTKDGVPIGTKGLVFDGDIACGGTVINSAYYRCDDCRQMINVKVCKPHTWENISVDEPTCTEGGLIKRECTECGAEGNVIKDSKGHTLTGSYNHGNLELRVTCSECDYSEILKDVAPTLERVIGAPTCAKTGLYEYSYKFIPLGMTSEVTLYFLVNIDKLSHTVKDADGNDALADSFKDASGKFDYKLPFLTVNGELNACGKTTTAHYTCTECSEKVTVTAVRNHVNTVWTQDTPPTCTENGVEISVCDVCGINGIVERPIPALGYHTYDRSEYKSDESGHWYECSCGAKEELLSHAFGDGVSIPHEECGGYDRTDYTCLECGYVKTEYGDTVYHDYDRTEYKKDENGHWYECGCGNTDGYSTHNFGDGIFIPREKCDEYERTEFTCTDCGYVKTVLGERGQHAPIITSYEINVTPDFMNDGQITFVCSECGVCTERLPKIDDSNSEVVDGTGMPLVKYTYTISTGYTVELEVPLIGG